MVFPVENPDCCSDGGGLERVVAEFAGADADRLLDRIDEDLAVADAARLRGGADRVDRLFGELVRADDLDLTFGRKSTTYSAPR
jgi:hypothetical protein